MQLTGALCYVLLTITMTATCIEAEEDRKHELEERKTDRKLSKREASIFINSIPERGVDRFHNPKVIYRRYSKPRYGSKPKYGSARPKYGPPKSTRNSVKKYRSKMTPKYGPPGHKKRSPKPRYGPPKRQAMKPVHGLQKKKPSHALPSITYHPEPMGFGEPPRNDEQRSPDYNNFQTPGLANSQKLEFQGFQKDEFIGFQKPDFSDFHKQSSSNFYKPPLGHGHQNFNDFQKPSTGDYQKENFDNFQKTNDYPETLSYGEPPVDSYGAPIKPNLHDLTYPTANSDTFNQFDQDTFSSTLQSWKSYQQDQNIDNKYAFSKKYPASTVLNSDAFTPIPDKTEAETDLNSYSDIFNYRQMKNKVKKPYSNVKIVRKPWKDNRNMNDDIIVGGQYAEPPAIHVPTFRSRDPEFPSDDDSAFPGDLSYSELLASNNSPYVNYKNSNMAFSPQNLNDAFSSR